MNRRSCASRTKTKQDALRLSNECARQAGAIQRWKTGPRKGQRQLGSECRVNPGDSGREAYRAIAHGSEGSSPAFRGGPTS
jgi:hypothetical protein